MDGLLPHLTIAVDRLYMLSILESRNISPDSMEEDEAEDHQVHLKSLVKMYCGLVILSTLNGRRHLWSQVDYY
jgi:hypothetical protein